MNITTTPGTRHWTFSFFDHDAEIMLFGSEDQKMEEHELELLVLKLWNMQTEMKDTIGMELAQA